MEQTGGNMKRYAFAALITGALFAVQFLFSRLGWFAAGLIDYSSFDKENLFARLSVHHIIQMLLALLLIFILVKTKKAEGFKLAPKYDSKGIKYTLIFCAVLTAYYAVLYIAGSFTGTIRTFDHELNAVNVTGYLGFQLLLSGPSEEILFHSLPIALLLSCLKTGSKKDNAIAIVIAAVLFGIAHVDIISFSFDLFQVCYAFVLGLFYGYTFIKSKSVIYPMIMHSMSNVISVGGCYIYMLIVANR